VSDTVTLEYLGTPAPDRRRTPYVVAAVIGVLVLAGAGFLWWSDSVRTSANEALASAFRESIDGAAAGERQVQGTLAYASPMIWSASVPEDVRDGLRALVEASAAEASGRLGVLRERVAATTVLPWQGPQAAARAELLALIDAQRARFDGIANDASDIDRILADGPLPVGAATEALRAADAD
jgi:type II secretory pathway pseudopilin PulG